MKSLQQICPSTTVLIPPRRAGSYGQGYTRVNYTHLIKPSYSNSSTLTPSEQEHQTLVQNAEAILQALQLPYRIVMTGADLS